MGPRGAGARGCAWESPTPSLKEPWFYREGRVGKGSLLPLDPSLSSLIRIYRETDPDEGGGASPRFREGTRSEAESGGAYRMIWGRTRS